MNCFDSTILQAIFTSPPPMMRLDLRVLRRGYVTTEELLWSPKSSFDFEDLAEKRRLRWLQAGGW